MYMISSDQSAIVFSLVLSAPAMILARSCFNPFPVTAMVKQSEKLTALATAVLLYNFSLAFSGVDSRSCITNECYNNNNNNNNNYYYY